MLRLDTRIVCTFDAFFQDISATLADRWGRNQFDLLINNAGIDAPSPIALTTEEAFDSLVNVHVKGVYCLTRKALPLPGGLPPSGSKPPAACSCRWHEKTDE